MCLTGFYLASPLNGQYPNQCTYTRGLSGRCDFHGESMGSSLSQVSWCEHSITGVLSQCDRISVTSSLSWQRRSGERYANPSLPPCDADHSPSEFFPSGISKISVLPGSVGDQDDFESRDTLGPFLEDLRVRLGTASDVMM